MPPPSGSIRARAKPFRDFATGRRPGEAPRHGPPEDSSLLRRICPLENLNSARRYYSEGSKYKEVSACPSLSGCEYEPEAQRKGRAGDSRPHAHPVKVFVCLRRSDVLDRAE